MTAPITLVFDLDDTLYAERDYVLSGLAAAGDYARTARNLNGFAEVCRALFAAGVRGSIFDQALMQLGQPSDADFIARLVQAYRAHSPSLELHGDAETLLSRLAGRARLGLITDGPAAMQRAKIAALKLDGRLDRCIVTDELGGRDFWKPHPRAFELLEAALPAARFAYVADNPSKDFVAPNARGWHSVQIVRQNGEYRSAQPAPGGEPECRIETLTDLPRLFPELLAM